jgi:hypothetical protein
VVEREAKLSRDLRLRKIQTALEEIINDVKQLSIQGNNLTQKI